MAIIKPQSEDVNFAPAKRKVKEIDIMFSKGDEYSRLSNMAPRSFELDGNRWPNVETYFQWRKAKLFKDEKTAALLEQTSDPYEARRLGRQVKGFIPGIWKQMKVSLMEKGIKESFNQNPLEKDFLCSLYGARFTHVKGGEWAEMFPRILMGVQEEFALGLDALLKERDFYFDIIQSGYRYAEKSNELVRGEFAKDFAGPVHWSRILELPFVEWNGLRGVSYIDFVDCTNAYALKRDGESVSVHQLSLQELKVIASEMKHHLNLKIDLPEKKPTETKPKVKEVKSGGLKIG